jgi:YidC/Oxa1 family membrane protein insertase
MDRNSIIGMVLIFVILISFAYINQPSQSEIDALKQKQDSIAFVNHQADSIAQVQAAQSITVNPVVKDTNAINNQFGDFAQFATGTESISTFENEQLRVSFTNKGGRIYKVELKNYKRSDGSPLVLLDGNSSNFAYQFPTVQSKAISSDQLYYALKASPDNQHITYVLDLGNGKRIEHQFDLSDNDYRVKFQMQLNGMESVIASNTNFIDVNWTQQLLLQEKTQEAEERTSTIYYRYADDEPDYLSEAKDLKEELKTPIQWVSFKQQYFNTSLVAEKPFTEGVIETKKDEQKEKVKFMSANLILPFNHGSAESHSFFFYFGPNHYKTLQQYNVQLERVVPMGWGIFGWVNKYLTVNVFYWLGQYLSNFGIIIFLLTLIVKTILFPLVYRSYLSSAKMRVLKPEMDIIKEKYGNDMAKLQQENMKLYRKAGVNPMGGCVPVLLQMPILIAMFQFFPSAFELRQQSFLWATDLSTYDSIFSLPFNIPFYGDHVSLFTLLMTASTLVYTVYNNQMTGVTGQMKYLSYIMPVMFLGFFNSYSSGLTYYYFVSNLFTIGQQLLIRSFVDEKSIHRQVEENKKKPVTKSKLQVKLEEMARKRGIDPDKLNK